MTATDPQQAGIANTITGGVFFSSVIQGRDIQVVLPAEVIPALTGLPAASVVFTGRDHLLAALCQALRPEATGGVQLVSAVAGLAGIGKTEVVLHAANQALDAGWFAGGVLFVDLFGYDPRRRLSAADALAGWLSAIGIPGEHIPSSEQDRSRLWRSVLDAYSRQNRRLLLIIDNASSKEQIVPLLPGDTRVPVLVTSRHTLDLDARLHDLDVIEPDPAASMIRDVIASRRGDADSRLQGDQRNALSDLAALCAGLPLALRIVAALLADRPHLQPRILAGRLASEQTRLDGLAREQVAVRSAFDLSHQHLTADQAYLFRLLPVNPGPDITTISATHLAGLPEPRIAALLADLHRAHLITEPAPERWGMHDLGGSYAAEKQRPDTDTNTNGETEEARQRLFTYYLETTRTANTHLHPTISADISTFPDRTHALAWLDAEHRNLMALATTASRHQPTATCELAFTLNRFLVLRRHITDSIAIATLARDAFRQNGDLRGEGQMWYSLGVALRQMRRFDEAITAHTRAHDIYQQTDDQHGEGQAWNGMGNTLGEMRRFDEAITAHTRALAIFQQTGDLHDEGAALNCLGLALSEIRQFDEAITAHTQAQFIFQQIGDLNAESEALSNLGTALQQVFRLNEAIAVYTRAHLICQQTGDLHGEGQTFGNLGVALCQLGRFDEAITALTRARDICQQTGNVYGEGQTWTNLGLALAGVRRFSEAIAAHTKARTICQQIGDLHGEAAAWDNLGRALVSVRRFDEAIAAHARARDLYQQTGDLHGEGTAWGKLGIALGEALRFDEAITAHTRAADMYQRAGDRHSEGVAWAKLGSTLRQVRRFDETRNSYQRAIDAFTETGDTASAQGVRRWLAELPR